MVLAQIKVHVDGARRLTAPGQTIDCSWDCSTQAGVGGIRYRVNGGAWSVVSVRTTRRPDYSPMPSRMPGAPAGTMASFTGYGVILLASLLPLGAVEVQAEALDASLAPIGALDPIRVYNDSDGLDRRPSTREVWLDADAGDDANTGYGGWGNAVRTRHRAIAQARATPGGATAAARDCGGAVIHMRGTFTDGEPSSTAPQWHTSGFWWLTFVGHDGAKWRRTNAKFYDQANDNLFADGHGLGPCACRIRLQGVDIDGTGPTIYARGSTNQVAVHVWLEGGRWGSAQFVDGQIRIRYHEDHKDVFCDTDSDSGTPGSMYLTGVLRQGCMLGMASPTFAHDCVIDSTLGGDLYYVGTKRPTSKAICIRTRRHDHERNITLGWAANRTTFGSPEQLEAEVLPGGGSGGADALRILGPVSGVPFGVAAADLVGAVHTRLGVFGWGSNDGAWPVLAGGTIGGRPYVDVDHPSGTGGLAPGGTEIETVCRNVQGGWQRVNEFIHPSFKSFDGRGRTGDVFHTCSAEDMDNDVQASFANGFSTSGIWIKNVRDSGNQFVVNWRSTLGEDPTSITDSIIEDCTWSGTLAIADGNSLPYTGLVIRNCVFGQAQATTQDAIDLGAQLVSCHFITGPTFGTGATSGAWFKSPGPTVSPFSMEPLDVWKGGGLGAHVADWSWTGTTAATKGCLKNVGLVDWSEGETGAIAAAPAPTGPSVAVPTVAATIGGDVHASCDAPAGPDIDVPTASAVVDVIAACSAPVPPNVSSTTCQARVGVLANVHFVDFPILITVRPFDHAVVGALAACAAPAAVSVVSVPAAEAITEGAVAACPPPQRLASFAMPEVTTEQGVAAGCPAPAPVVNFLLPAADAQNVVVGIQPPQTRSRQLWLRAPRNRITFRPLNT